jgi:hypothetical protein
MAMHQQLHTYRDLGILWVCDVQHLIQVGSDFVVIALRHILGVPAVSV